MRIAIIACRRRLCGGLLRERDGSGVMSRVYINERAVVVYARTGLLLDAQFAYLLREDEVCCCCECNCIVVRFLLTIK